MSSFAPAERLAATVAAAEPRLRDVPAESASIRPAPDRWSPREIVGHLVDSASNNHQRFVRATWQPNLVFSGYQQDGWVELQRYQEADWLDLVTLWASFNRHLARVMAAVPDAVRTKVHTEHNLQDVAFRAPSAPEQATLAYFMADYVDHLEHHLRQLLGQDGRR